MDKTARLLAEIEREGETDPYYAVMLTSKTWDALKAKYAAKPAKRIPAKRATPRNRKTVVRLRGPEMATLREDVYQRDGARCIDCELLLSLDAPPGQFNRMELSHIKSRGAGGSDTLENTVCRCRECHAKSHNAGGKPCPKKGRL